MLRSWLETSELHQKRRRTDLLLPPPLGAKSGPWGGVFQVQKVPKAVSLVGLGGFFVLASRNNSTAILVDASV